MSKSLRSVALQLAATAALTGVFGVALYGFANYATSGVLA